MSVFRSETMEHGTLVLPADRARDIIEILGAKSHIQFTDMNESSMLRQYRKYLQRITEMERILRFLYEEIKKLPGLEIIPANIDTYLDMEHTYSLDEIERSLKEIYTHFLRFQENNMSLAMEKKQAIEERAVVNIALKSLISKAGKDSCPADRIVDGGGMDTDSKNHGEPGSVGIDDLSMTQGTSIGFSNICGVISMAEQERFARALFRATRGNAYTFFEEIPDEIVDTKTSKPASWSVFVIYFQYSAGATALKSKIHKICNAYGVNLHVWPSSVSEAEDLKTKLDERIAEKSEILSAYETYFANEISALLEVNSPAGGSLIEEYRLFCLKEKAIYATLNMFQGEEHILRADCWLPQAEGDTIRQLLMKTVKPDQAAAFLLTDKIQTKEQPPTYNPVTEFTESFQVFVNSYGIPRYKEINPAYFTTITFPFLFGIMYGDIGHATILFIASIYLIMNWEKIKRQNSEIVGLVAYGRYMLLLMSLFGIYFGFLYNDFFSLGLNLFGTRYQPGPEVDKGITYTFIEGRQPYPLGFDPAWKGAVNEVEFTNSFKMKFSIIIGFSQMLFGVMLHGVNTLYDRDWTSFIFEFLPHLIFLLSLVGYMTLLILVKWISAPRLINGVLNRPLIIGTITELCMMQPPSILLFESQPTLHTLCFYGLVVTVPLMLFVKPTILTLQHRKKTKHIQDQEWQALEDDHFEAGETWVHQLISTIEFVLGCLSNTASYLRLWALSLAHQQLSKVFFDLTILNVLSMEMNVVVVGMMLFVVFAVFAAITVAVMLCMDTLECYLHALRLQWVEFQNKFFVGDGYQFHPLDFHQILSELPN